MNLEIRNETPEDYLEVEELTREAFWNLYVPGCDEHYLVHCMRSHPDFIGSLDFVAVHQGRIIGNIMYTKSHVLDESGRKLETLTFGPISVLPEFQRKGVGSTLIEHTRALAIQEGFPAILIYGNPSNYCKHGFKNCSSFGITNLEGKYPLAMLVLELKEGVFSGHQWKFFESKAYEIDHDEAAKFDKQFKPKKLEYRYTQEEFSMTCRAFIE
jgi:putative acetyltransferase